MSNKFRIKNASLRFWTDEAILLIFAAFFAFALVGYGVLACVFLGLALLVALFKIISILGAKNEKLGKRLKISLSALVLLGLALLIAVEIPIIAAARTDKNPEAPYLIVLGAGVNGETPSLSLQNRLNAAEDYLRSFPDAKVIVSGGQGPGENITEAECMRRYLAEAGIAPERIIMEPRATSTNENLAFSLEIIEKRGDDPEKKVAIVSSEYHLYRAKYMAEQQGALPLGVAGKTTLPLLKVNYFIREALAVMAMWLSN
ncbi:MAG: YdcF family protein [Oscillospiraceae bacterium]